MINLREEVVEVDFVDERSHVKNHIYFLSDNMLVFLRKGTVPLDFSNLFLLRAGSEGRVKKLSGDVTLDSKGRAEKLFDGTGLDSILCDVGRQPSLSLLNSGPLKRLVEMYFPKDYVRY